MSEWAEKEDIGSGGNGRRPLVFGNIRRMGGTAVEEPSETEVWSVGTRLLIKATRTTCKVVCGGIERASSMVESDSKAPGLEMMELGDRRECRWLGHIPKQQD